VADLGIILLLFSIGLKLDVRGLLKAEIWASATAQMMITTAFMYLVLLLGQHLFPVPLMEMSWQAILVLGFALSFSSTVFAVKVLEEKGI
jgi:predicted Kef-type K+ transport protein